MKEIDFIETGHFWPGVVPWRLADLRPLSQNYLHEFEKVSENFSKILLFQQKLFSLLLRSDRLTDAHTSKY
jgi:hypothetical protein